MTTRSVYGLFDSREQVVPVIRELTRAGFSISAISVLVPAPPGADATKDGDSVGLLSGLVEVVIPRLRSIIGAGPLVATLAGWSTGGVAHGLIALQIPERLAQQYEQKIGEGCLLLSVQSDDADALSRLTEIFEQHQAEHVGVSTEGEGDGVTARPSRPPEVIHL